MIIVGIIIVIVVIGLAGAYTLSQPPAPKSQLVIGTTDSCETGMDPAYAYDFFGWEMIQSLSSGLVEYRPGTTGLISDIVPALATSWTNSDGGLIWTFNLRQGVYFQDGREFTASDVKYSFDRGNTGINSPDGAFQGIGYSAIVSNVTVVDQFTVRFYLSQPYAAFLALMTVPCTYMVTRTYAPYNEIVNYTAGNPRLSTPCDLGPYLLQSWTRTAGKDVQISLTANPNYWNASGGYPKTKNIIITMYSDAASLSLAIAAHQIDIAFRQLTVDDFKSLSTNSAVKVWSAPSSFVQYLVFQEKNTSFTDPALRIAVASAINRSLICSTVYANLASPLYSMIPNGMSFHRDVFNVSAPKGTSGLNYANFNYTRTVDILASKGYSTSNKLVVNLFYETSGHYPQSPELAQALKTSMEASGYITVNLNGLDWPAMGAQRRAETMDVYIMGWYPDFIEADDYIQPFYQSSGSAWLHNNYDNPYMDQLVTWSRFNTTFAGQDLSYYKIQNISVSDCPLVPIYQYGQFAVTKPTIQGVYLDATMNWRNWLLYNGTA